MNTTRVYNITFYNNTTNDEKPQIIEEVFGYVAITLLIIVIMFCCYIKPKHYIDEKERIERAKTRLAYRYRGTVSV